MHRGTWLCSALALLTGPLGAQWVPDRPDGRAPAGVAADHVLREGEWEFSYDFQFQSFADSRDGNDRLSNNEVLADYSIAPTRLQAETHWFGLGHELFDDWTVRAELPYEDRSQFNTTAAGQRFQYRSEGLGDARLWLMPVIDRGSAGIVHASAGISLPTGSIDENGLSAGGVSERLPFALQLGSGTVDLLPGITWQVQSEEWSFGAQGLATLRIGENSNDYTLGNRFEATGWGARRLSESTSASLRLGVSHWEDVSGSDPAMRPAIEPGANPDAQGGTRCDLFAGVNWFGTGDFLPGQRLAAEVGIPLLQDLNGPQLENDWTVQLSLELRFGGQHDGAHRVM